MGELINAFWLVLQVVALLVGFFVAFSCLIMVLVSSVEYANATGLWRRRGVLIVVTGWAVWGLFMWLVMGRKELNDPDFGAVVFATVLGFPLGLLPTMLLVLPLLCLIDYLYHREEAG